jgi:hypothetical protein
MSATALTDQDLLRLLERLEIPLSNREPEECSRVLQEVVSSSLPYNLLNDFKYLIAAVEDFDFANAERIFWGIKNSTQKEAALHDD